LDGTLPFRFIFQSGVGFMGFCPTLGFLRPLAVVMEEVQLDEAFLPLFLVFFFFFRAGLLFPLGFC